VPAAREKLDVTDNDVWVPAQATSRPVQTHPTTVIWDIYPPPADGADRAGSSVIGGLVPVAHPAILRAPSHPIDEAVPRRHRKWATR
jgi:hypothetical protein